VIVLKCPNCGTERFKKTAENIPKNLAVVGEVEVGQCSKAGCGKTVIYVVA